MKAKIVTRHVAPPIPERAYDWQAHDEGHEENGPFGFGKTEQDAIDALLDASGVPALRPPALDRPQ